MCVINDLETCFSRSPSLSTQSNRKDAFHLQLMPIASLEKGNWFCKQEDGVNRKRPFVSDDVS